MRKLLLCAPFVPALLLVGLAASSASADWLDVRFQVGRGGVSVGGEYRSGGSRHVDYRPPAYHRDSYRPRDGVYVEYRCDPPKPPMYRRPSYGAYGMYSYDSHDGLRVRYERRYVDCRKDHWRDDHRRDDGWRDRGRDSRGRYGFVDRRSGYNDNDGYYSRSRSYRDDRDHRRGDDWEPYRLPSRRY